jgi:Tol biopolymer transport system component
VWIDRSGKTEPLGLPAAVYGMFRIAPDGRRLCIERTEGAQRDIYVWDFSSKRLRRLTQQGCSRYPSWTPDGKRVVFAHSEDPRNIAWQSLGGDDEAELLYTSRHSAAPFSFFPGGRLLAFTDFDPETLGDIWVLSLKEAAPPRSVVKTPYSEWGPAFAPDGRWIAYVSDRRGQYQVYVQPYPGMDALWVVSDGYSEEPVWSPDGSELYYRSVDKWMAVSVSTQPEFTVGPPRLLFEGPYLNVAAYSYDIAPDGERFVVLQPEHDDSAVREIRVVLNWFEEVRRLWP